MEPDDKQPCAVIFQPGARTVETRQGRTLLEVCRQEGIRINSGCGGRGTCGKCLVRIVAGRVDPGDTSILSEEDREAGFVLACLARLAGPTVEVEVPQGVTERTVYVQPAGEARDCVAFSAADFPPDPFFSQGPFCTKIPLRLDPPSLDDPVTDFDKLHGGLTALPGAPPAFSVDFDALRPLGHVLREADWSVRAWVSALADPPRILQVEPASRTEANYGIAVDVGTTSLSACLCDLANLQPLAVARCLNSQSVHGADVITRIIAASQPAGLETLRSLVIEDVNSLVRALCKTAGVAPSSVTGMSLAGNTTMTQIALAVDPAHIRKEPYVATANSFPPVPAGALGLDIHSRALVRFLPCVSSYVGGDITAGVVATGMARQDEVTLFIDLGTNGEMVLGNRDWLVCCSCSVGPSFEGSGIRSGMLAEPGAIEAFTLDGDGVDLRTVGGEPPRGICGSGLIQAFSSLLEAGIIDRTAKFQPGHPRLRETDEGLAFLVATGPAGDILLTQPDLDTLLRSKAAVFAAAHLLLRKMDLTLDGVTRIMVAGTFGSHLDFGDAVAIGLLPDQPVEKYAFMGNTSLLGARACLGFLTGLAQAEDVARKMTYIELSGDNAYHEEFTLASFLPHTDLELFPSARRKQDR